MQLTIASPAGASNPAVNRSRARIARLAVKRSFDIVLALALLLLMLPLLLAIAAAVRLSSPGPVLFRQHRVGRDGRLFAFYKFRTMVHDNDPSQHRAYYEQLVRGAAPAVRGAYKIANDARITPFGGLLRRYSLDEFPQLLNVLKGDMSLVGPRPPIPYEVGWYGPRELQRFSVRPGLTGLWQVSGRSTLNFQQMIDLDLLYIDSWSLTRDLVILLRTPWAVVSGKGAR